MTPPSAGHRIRLRGPWQVVPLDDAGNVAGEVQTRKHPEDWPRIVAARAGRVRLTRVFHSPSNLDETETVFITLTGVRGKGVVRWNGEPLGAFTESQSSWEFPILSPMPFTNELSITVSFTAPTPDQPQVGVYGDVALDIRTVECPAAEMRAPRTIHP